MAAGRGLISGVVAVALMALTGSPGVHAGRIYGEKVLVVHSYHESQQGHVVEMTRGIEEAFLGSGVERQFFHMDTKRKKSLAWKQEAGRRAAALTDRYRPAVVITMDDNAQSFYAAEYARRPGSPMFVFSGVNADPSAYGFPDDTVTGVIERPNVRESLVLLKKIVPEAGTLVMLSDKSPTTDSFIAYARTLDLPLEVVAYEQPLTFGDWKAVIERYRDKVDAFGIYVIRTIQRSETDTTHVSEQELISYLNHSARKPTVGMFDSAARAGVLCGVSVSMREQGYAAARIALELLRGKRPADIPVRPTTKGRLLLNLKTAELLGVRVRYAIIRNAMEVIR